MNKMKTKKKKKKKTKGCISPFRFLSVSEKERKSGMQTERSEEVYRPLVSVLLSALAPNRKRKSAIIVAIRR